MKLEKEKRVKDRTFIQYRFTRVEVIRPKNKYDRHLFTVIDMACRFVMFDHVTFITGKKSE